MKRAALQLYRGILLAILITSAYQARAFYDPTIGRWISRDSMGEDIGGPNLYGFVDNAPLNAVDVLGNWIENVHLTLTQNTAARAGIQSGYASTIGEADVWIDRIWSSTGPIFSGQDRHLYYLKEGKDSREWWYEAEFKNTVSALDQADTTHNESDCRKAAESFGHGLHSKQDISSHRPFKDKNGTIMNWPHVLGHPSWWDDYGGFGLNSGTKTGAAYWAIRNGRPNMDYANWKSENGMDNAQQVVSQSMAQAQVEIDTRSGIDQFKQEVSKHCFCRKYILGN